MARNRTVLAHRITIDRLPATTASSAIIRLVRLLQHRPQRRSALHRHRRRVVLHHREEERRHRLPTLRQRSLRNPAKVDYILSISAD